jgi:hypothetical protein
LALLTVSEIRPISPKTSLSLRVPTVTTFSFTFLVMRT